MSEHPPTSASLASVIAAVRRAALQKDTAVEITALDPFKQAQVKDQETDTDLKRLYGKGFIILLALQLVAMNGVFVSVGFGWLKFSDPNHLSLFMGGTLAEVFGIVFVITKYLFSKKS